ncbi:50S ribosomal protein L2 [bacterium]|jgi:large subunit ribosomal protein L2|nr:50S ribosomal protein L2 [bacterium]MBT4251539.1 50S ribosomal protein L2 [bacterium]MBT4597801.1 50S ribosomal protein L2 [bacterium]MBT6753525.1 50S ribosomal protein L2 [bacterium]MBT7037747.1 50S ribosomal protein L2 [bacterium]
MAVKVYKKNTAGRRNMSVLKPDNLTDKKPEKALTKSINKHAGRSHGKISIRNRGGGARRIYRMIDFKVTKAGIPGKITAIEKDPNRTAGIALICYADGEKRYIIATQNMKAGDEILMDEVTPVREGNRMMLKNIPSGTAVCNVEMVAGKGAQMARSAGAQVVLQAIDAGMATLKLPSGEIRLVKEDCYATLGRISNFEHASVKIGKAGKSRHMGKRPKVRGSAMNPVDHPHGGGEGRQGVGMKYPKSPWGKHALGKKTRKKNKASNKFIVKRRKR